MIDIDAKVVHKSTKTCWQHSVLNAVTDLLLSSDKWFLKAQNYLNTA